MTNTLLILLHLWQIPVPPAETPAVEEPVVETPVVEEPAAEDAEAQTSESEPPAKEPVTTEAETVEPVETPAPATEPEVPAAETPVETTAAETAPVEEPAPAATPAEPVPVPENPVGEEPTQEPEPTAAERPQDPAQEWLPLNAVDLIINEELITSTDMQRALLRRSQPLSNPEERARQFQETAESLISQSLKVQAGRDMGFDRDMVDRFVNDHVDRSMTSAGSAGKLADQLENTHFNAATYQENIESRVLEDLWTGAVVGQYPGVGGRPFRDRYVRPERLEFEFERQEGGLDLPSSVILQELVCDPARTGSLESARDLAIRLHEQILAGGDFGELAVANGAADPDTLGVHKPLDEANVSGIPGIGEFLASAGDGDVSEVIPVRDQGVLRAWRIVKLIERDRGEVARFDDSQLQEFLRKSYLERLDDGRENDALSELLAAAYVWPPDFFGRKPEPVIGPQQEP